MSETSGDTQLSFKKPLRVRNELSGKRRNALKEYYKLKQQQQEVKEKKEESESEDEILTNEILQDKPIEEIDLQDAEFKEILQKTNKLTSSINLINSSIKDIIYNNYYELIKLNDYLEEFNDLNSSIYKKKKESKDLLSILEDKEEVKVEEDGFLKLNKLMKNILDFNEIEFNSKIQKHDESITNTINSLILNKDEESIDKLLKKEIEESLKLELQSYREMKQNV